MKSIGKLSNVITHCLFSGARRSRSVPRSSASDCGPSTGSSSKSSRWKDLPPRPILPNKEGVELKVYEVDDPHRIQQQRPDTIKVRETFMKSCAEVE